MISPVVHKVFVLLSCTFLGLICGTLYLYSSYSPQFAKQLDYSVTDSSTIALLGTIGVAVAGPVAGAVVDSTGYTLAMLVGGSAITLGYIGMKAQFDRQFSNLFVSAFLLFSIGAGSTFINLACLKCCSVSFPSIRGVATSLPLALYGLSALFYSVIASTFYPGDTSSFLGFMAYSSVGIFVLCAPSVMLCDVEHKIKRPVVQQRHSNTFELSTLRPGNSNITPQLSPKISLPGRSPGYIAQTDYNHTLRGIQLVKSYEFWLIFIVTGSLAALGQMYIYSVGYMVKALITHSINLANIDGTQISGTEIESILQKDQQLQVGLLSIANCIGRIVSGVMGDIISQSFGKSRSWLLYIPCIGLLVTQVMSAKITEYSSLSANSLLTGLFYGFTFCMMPIIVGDTFGMVNFSSNWGVVSLAPIIPSFYLTSLFGKIYDSNSQLVSIGDLPTNDHACLLGSECYSSIFTLTFVVALFSIFVVTILNVGAKMKLPWLRRSQLDQSEILISPNQAIRSKLDIPVLA